MRDKLELKVKKLESAQDRLQRDAEALREELREKESVQGGVRARVS